MWGSTGQVDNCGSYIKINEIFGHVLSKDLMQKPVATENHVRVELMREKSSIAKAAAVRETNILTRI